MTILARSFLYNYNIRRTNPAVIFSPHFLNVMSSFCPPTLSSPTSTFIVDMDADTYFAPDCISELLKQSHYLHTVGVCGYVTASSTPSSRWLPWTIYQFTEYTISQCLRRLHQSIATHKVSCLLAVANLSKSAKLHAATTSSLNASVTIPPPPTTSSSKSAPQRARTITTYA